MPHPSEAGLPRDKNSVKTFVPCKVLLHGLLNEACLQYNVTLGSSCLCLTEPVLAEWRIVRKSQKAG